MCVKHALLPRVILGRVESSDRASSKYWRLHLREAVTATPIILLTRVISYFRNGDTYTAASFIICPMQGSRFPNYLGRSVRKSNFFFSSTRTDWAFETKSTAGSFFFFFFSNFLIRSPKKKKKKRWNYTFKPAPRLRFWFEKSLYGKKKSSSSRQGADEKRNQAREYSSTLCARRRSFLGGGLIRRRKGVLSNRGVDLVKLWLLVVIETLSMTTNLFENDLLAWEITKRITLGAPRIS